MLDDFIRRQRDLVDSVRGPLDEAKRLRSMYDGVLRPLRDVESLFNNSAVAYEIQRQREYSEEISRLMRPTLADLNIFRSPLPEWGADVALGWLDEHRRLAEM